MKPVSCHFAMDSCDRNYIQFFSLSRHASLRHRSCSAATLLVACVHSSIKISGTAMPSGAAVTMLMV